MDRQMMAGRARGQLLLPLQLGCPSALKVPPRLAGAGGFTLLRAGSLKLGKERHFPSMVPPISLLDQHLLHWEMIFPKSGRRWKVPAREQGMWEGIRSCWW